MDSQKWVASFLQGILAEERFFRIIGTLSLPWLLQCERASDCEDWAGIDAIAHLRTADGRVVRVPIQIKSSQKGKGKYYRERPLHWKHRVIVCIIDQKTTDYGLRGFLMRELSKVHRGKFSYDEIFDEVAAMQVELNRKVQLGPSLGSSESPHQEVVRGTGYKIKPRGKPPRWIRRMVLYT